jgi:hypothetical protein
MFPELTSPPCRAGASSRGQVSTELLVAVIVLLAFFVSVLIYNSLMTSDSNLIVSGIKARGDCTRLAYMISEVYSSGDGAAAFFDLDQPAAISSKRYVSFGGINCRFLANTGDYSLGEGKISLVNQDSNVIITQG